MPRRKCLTRDLTFYILSALTRLASQPKSTSTYESHMFTSTQVLADIYLWDLAILRYIFSEEFQV